MEITVPSQRIAVGCYASAGTVSIDDVTISLVTPTPIPQDTPTPQESSVEDDIWSFYE